jgi:hypothetical protein
MSLQQPQPPPALLLISIISMASGLVYKCEAGLDCERSNSGNRICYHVTFPPRSSAYSRRSFHVQSLHCSYVSLSSKNSSILYQVERVKDGRVFALRSVKCKEGGKTLAILLISFTSSPSVVGPTLNYSMPLPSGL